MRRADGTGGAQTLLPLQVALGDRRSRPATASGSCCGRSIFEAGKGDIYGVRMGDTTLVPLVDGPATEVDAAVSPDGRWLAYASDESGVFEIYVRPFPDAASARWQVSAAGGTDPVWSRSGRELFYLSAQNEMMSVEVAPGRGVLVQPAEAALLDRAVHVRSRRCRRST